MPKAKERWREASGQPCPISSSYPTRKIIITGAYLFFSIYYARTLNLRENAEKLKIILRPTNPLCEMQL